MNKGSGKDDKPGPSMLDRLKRVFNRGRKQVVSEADIKHLVTDNEELLDAEKRMIREILDLDELNVSEVMTPRVDIIAAEDTETVLQVIERMRGTGYSRLPVYHEDLDTIIGIVHYKDLISAIMDDCTSDPVADYVNKALFVPESKDLFPLLSEMQAKRQQMALVVDEYGGIDGLITVEDIVEEIVGEISDESDLEAVYLTPLPNNEWLVDGRLSVEDAQALGWPVEDSDEYETIAGWLMNETDAVPQVGNEFIHDGYRFKVQRMRRRRIQNLRVSRLSNEEPSVADVDTEGPSKDVASQAQKSDN